ISGDPGAGGRRPPRRGWGPIAGVGVVALTPLLGNPPPPAAQGASPARAGRPAAPAADPHPFHQIGARWCGAKDGSGSWLSPIGLSAKVMKRTGLCKGMQQAGDKVYCNNTSLLSLIDPTNHDGGNSTVNAVAASPMTPSSMRLNL